MPSAFLRPFREQPRTPHLLIGLVALCLLSCAACSRVKPDTSETSTTPGTTPPQTAHPLPRTAMPARTGTSPSGFTLLDNRRMRLSDYLGHVVVLDFYATWCPPCREETPHLVALQKRYGPQGLHVIGLNVGGADDRFQVPQYVAEFKIQYTLGYPDPEMTDLYLSDDDRIPQAFVFDRRGRLVKRFVSYDRTMPAELERVVQAALAAGAD